MVIGAPGVVGPSAWLGNGQPPDRGGDGDLFNRVKNGDAHTIRDAQTWLNAKGYNLAVDGMWGPHTARALRNSFAGIHPNVHNAQTRAIQNKHPQTGKFQPAVKYKGGGKPGKNAGGGGGKGGGGGMGNVAPQKAPGLMNPTKQAQSMANAEYNPAINSLKQALLDLATQGKYDQGQVKGYYGQMNRLDKSQSAEQGANQQAELQDVTQNLGNVAQLFGAQNAQQMQPAVGNATGLIGAEGKSEQDYLANMLPLLQAQGAQGVQNIDQTTLAQQRNYNDQLTQQQQAKGQAYNSDYQQALANQTQQQQNAMALQQAQAMFPSQLSAARATARADRANANAAPAYNQAKINAQNAAIQRDNVLNSESKSVIQKNMAEARKAAMSGKAGVLSPGSTSFNRIQTSLYKGMTNSAGKFTITNPVRAQHALYQQAVASGLISKDGRPLVKGAIKLLNSTLGNMYQRDAAWQKGWKWNGSKFVPIKK